MSAKALARNNINYLVWGNHFLVTLFRNPFIHHQWGSLADVGMPPTWEKGSHLPPRTTKLCNLRNGCDSITAPLLNQIWDSLLSKNGAEVQSPPRDARNLTGPHWGWHRYIRQTGRLSHQTSDLSWPHNLLPKGCDLCIARYQVQGEEVVVCPVAIR